MNDEFSDEEDAGKIAYHLFRRFIQSQWDEEDNGVSFNTYLTDWEPDALDDPSVESYKKAYECDSVLLREYEVGKGQDIQAGDRLYVMLKHGDTIGLLAKGMFISGAYDMADEAGKKYRYAQAQLNDLGHIERPPLSLADLEAALPEYDWRKPHLNLRLSKKVTKKLNKVWGGEL